MSDGWQNACAWALLFAGLAVLGACAVNPVSGRADLVLMSEGEELELGRRAHPQILERYGRYEDETLQAYVETVGERVAALGHRRDIVYRFTILDSAEVNAFALPGGYVYITRGLLAYLSSEAQLAAVLGHEIGHVTARHSVRQISSQRLAEIGYVIGSVFVPELRTASAQSIFNVLGGALISGYGREYELEADRLGAEYLARSGYDPYAMTEVIGVLKDQELFERQLANEEGREPRVYHGVFATHPKNDQRLQEVVGTAASLQVESTPQVHGLSRPEFVRKLDGLVFGDSAREGVRRGNGFYHEGLGFALKFPEGWRADNRPDRLTVFPANRQAYLQVTTEDINKAVTPAQFLESRLDLKALDRARALSVDELEGYTGVARLNGPFGSRGTRVAAIYLDKRAFIFVGAGEDKRSPEPYDSKFLEVIESFHRLSALEMAFAIPLKLRIVTANRGATFATYARESKIPHHSEAQLRLLNQRYPTGEPASGELIKLVD